MLSLASATAPEWVARALAHLDEILLDHAHCEKKAASTAVSLLFRYAENPAVVETVPALAREELAHFERVLAVLGARGYSLPTAGSEPVRRRTCCAAVRPTEPERLLDTLLCLALIEARSCERMRLLAEALETDEVGSPLRESARQRGPPPSGLRRPRRPRRPGHERSCAAARAGRARGRRPGGRTAAAPPAHLSHRQMATGPGSAL